MDEPRVTVASWADEEQLVAELAAGEEDFGHLSIDGVSRRATVTIYPRIDGRDWRVDRQEIEDLLARARDRLEAGLTIAG